MKSVTLGTAGRHLSGSVSWGFNDFKPHRDRPADAWFQLHPWAILPKSERDQFIHWTGPGPIYTVEDLSHLNPLAELYPLAKVEAALGAGPWCSSIDYMLALAIYEGFERIFVSRFDVQIGAPRERLMEHCSGSYWTGYARGRGIQVEHGGHFLRFPYRYGFDYQAERTFGARMSFWAALNMLSLKFDDGAATSDVEGWEGDFTDAKVRVSI